MRFWVRRNTQGVETLTVTVNGSKNPVYRDVNRNRVEKVSDVH